MTDLVQQLAKEIAVRPNQIEAAIKLIDEGASVPFIARYRKEVTQGLDDAQLRQLDTRLAYLRDLFERRDKVIESLKEQDKLSDDLLARVNAAETKNALEEIYAPYRPKRTSKSFKAKEAGLGPIAEKIFAEAVDPAEALADFSHEDYPDLESQLDAIQHILIDDWAQNIALTTELKAMFAKTATLKSLVASDEKKEVGKKFRDYFDFSENLNKVPSHRLLAMLRGRQENVLGLKVDGEDDAPLARIETEYSLETAQPQARQDYLKQTAKLFWLGKVRPSIEHSLLTEKRLAAESEAMDVFAENLRHLLLSAPAGARTTLGVDPGIRTGVKLAVVNASGDVLAHSTIYPFAPKDDKVGSIAELARLCREFNVDLIAIGNGTASRETESVVAEMMAANSDLKLTRVSVSEAGAYDYLPKPFNPNELLARIRAVLRRQVREVPGAPSQQMEVVSFGPWSLDLSTRTLTREGQVVTLTTGEFAVLKALVQHPREPLTRDKLMNLARGREWGAMERSIDVQVSRLRRLVEENPARARYIQTVWGVGYVFVPDGAE